MEPGLSSDDVPKNAARDHPAGDTYEI